MEIKEAALDPAKLSKLSILEVFEDTDGANESLGIRFARGLFSVGGRVWPQALGLLAYRFYRTTKRFGVSDGEKELLTQAKQEWYELSPGRKFLSYQWGDPSLPKILLVHGWYSQASHFGYYVSILLQAGYCVVALDGPSHGESPGDESDVYEYSAALQVMQAQFGPFEAIIAHSVGGIVTAMTLKKGLSAKKIVVINTPCRGFSLVEGHFKKYLHIPYEVIEQLRQRLEKKHGADVWDDTAADTHVRDNTIPTLIIHDVDDPIVPYSQGRLLRDAWANSEFLKTRDLGHHRMLMHQPTIEQIIQFIQK